MSAVGLIDDTELSRYIFKSKIDEGVFSYDGISTTIERDFQAFCTQGTPTELFRIPILRTPGLPQRYIVELRTVFSRNSGSVNSAAAIRYGCCRLGITTTQAGTATAYTLQTSANYGAPGMLITFANIVTASPSSLFFVTTANITNSDAWTVGTVKLIQVLSK